MPHIETSQLICKSNQLTGFYMRATLALNGLINPLIAALEHKRRKFWYLVFCNICTFAWNILFQYWYNKNRIWAVWFFGKTSSATFQLSQFWQLPPLSSKWRYPLTYWLVETSPSDPPTESNSKFTSNGQHPQDDAKIAQPFFLKTLTFTLNKICSSPSYNCNFSYCYAYGRCGTDFTKTWNRNLVTIFGDIAKCEFLWISVAASKSTFSLCFFFF